MGSSLKINGVVRGQYKQMCSKSWYKCNGDEKELDFKIRRAVDLGKHTYTYKNGCKIIRYHFLNFLIDDNEIMTMWKDSSRPPYHVSEDLKKEYRDERDPKAVFIKFPNKEDINEKGFNKNIKIDPKQTADSLMEYGFTNHRESSLYYYRDLGRSISFNILINKESLEIERLDVLDEDFLQVYDYQSFLINDSNFQPAKVVYHRVNEILSELQEDGIITGFEVGMYV